jgi:hypothetical protein
MNMAIVPKYLLELITPIGKITYMKPGNLDREPELWIRKNNQSAYRVCLKFFPLGGSQIPLNPPCSKGDFTSNSL